jgi:hypothetical protein
MNFRIALVFCLLAGGVRAQKFPFDVHVRPHYTHSALGVQAFAYAQVGDNILIIGGRKDGLHRRQPFASMDSAGNSLRFTI